MIIPDITLNEEEGKKNKKQKNKTFKKVNFIDFENNLIDSELKNQKNHLIVIKKKRNRDLDFPFSKEANIKNDNFSKQKNNENNNLINAQDSNLKINNDTHLTNETLFDKSMNENLNPLESEKYNFSLGSLVSGEDYSEKFNPDKDFNERFKNYNIKNFSNTNLFENFNHQTLSFPNINMINHENLFNCSPKDFQNSSTINSKNLNNKNLIFKKSLAKINEDCEVFKNYFPLVINSEITRSIQQKRNLDLMIQEQNKFEELKKLNILQKRNMLSNKIFMQSEFKHLQNKYRNIFGENFSKSTKLLNNDEIMVIHTQNLTDNNPHHLEPFLNEIKDNTQKNFEIEFYEINNLNENKFNLNNFSEKFLLDQIKECEYDEKLYYEKENPNKDDSEIESQLKHEDNDSNREDNPAFEYPDEESSDSGKFGKNKKYDSYESDDVENFADIYNQKYFSKGKKNRNNSVSDNQSYCYKIKKLEHKLNKEFESMEISNDNSKIFNFKEYNKKGVQKTCNNNNYSDSDSEGGYGDYDYY